MRVIAKQAKTHPAAKKCCGWEEPAIYVYELISRPSATPDSDTRTGWTYFNTKLGCKKMQQVLRNARKFLNLMNTRTPVSGIILSPCMNNYNVKNTILSEKFFKV